MKRFDRQAFHDKVSRSCPPQVAGRLTRRMVKAINLAERMGVTVWYDGRCRNKGLFYINTRQVVIQPNLPIERQLVTLLHELGHARVSRSRRRTLYYEGHGSPGKRTPKKMLQILEEEIFAWREARRLAKVHGIGINKAYFDHIVVESLGSYVRSAAKPELLGRRRRFRP